jgi:hypothetical protein
MISSTSRVVSNLDTMPLLPMMNRSFMVAVELIVAR